MFELEPVAEAHGHETGSAARRGSAVANLENRCGRGPRPSARRPRHCGGAVPPAARRTVDPQTRRNVRCLYTMSGSRAGRPRLAPCADAETPMRSSSPADSRVDGAGPAA
jgi:hypothetical protein